MSPIDALSQNRTFTNRASFHSGKTGPNIATANTPAERKLHKAAAEFESILLSNLWKSMKSSLASDDSDSDDPAHQTLEELGVDSMSSAVGKAGGLGIGKLILKYLEPKLAESQIGTKPGPQIGDGSASNKAQPLFADTLR